MRQRSRRESVTADLRRPTHDVGTRRDAPWRGGGAPPKTRGRVNVLTPSYTLRRRLRAAAESPAAERPQRPAQASFLRTHREDARERAEQALSAAQTNAAGEQLPDGADLAAMDAEQDARRRTRP